MVASMPVLTATTSKSARTAANWAPRGVVMYLPLRVPRSISPAASSASLSAAEAAGSATPGADKFHLFFEND